MLGGEVDKIDHVCGGHGMFSTDAAHASQNDRFGTVGLHRLIVRRDHHDALDPFTVLPCSKSCATHRSTVANVSFDESLHRRIHRRAYNSGSTSKIVVGTQQLCSGQIL